MLAGGNAVGGAVFFMAFMTAVVAVLDHQVRTTASSVFWVPAASRAPRRLPA